MVEVFDYLIKFLIIGDPGTGKTCILRRFLDDVFREDTLHTIGVEFGTKIMQVGGKSLKLQIWDTAGQERFQCVTRSYYRDALGALVVYDISRRDSFKNVVDWISRVRDFANPDLAIVLIGNKSDITADFREVTESEARQFAEENGVQAFMETSAKLGDNIQEAFYEGARTALERAKTSNLIKLCIATGASNSNYLNSRPVAGNSINSCSGSC